jgi:biopolymer transport protein TolR
MAASFHTQGGKFRTIRRFRAMAEINVTPMVDVMLVLLIVFMVAAPLLTVGVPIDLPKTKADTLKGQDEPLSITVNAQGKIYLQETEIANVDELVPRLAAIAQNKKDTRIFVRGDRAINYGRVMEVMGMINGAGFTQVALVTDMAPRADPAAAKRR